MSKVIAVNQQKPARVVLAGTRGRPGPTIASATVNESGRLIITLEDGTEIDAGFIGGGGTGGGVWGAIVGDITAQLDLIERLGLKVDQSSYDAFVIAVNSALASRYTKTEADALLLNKVGISDPRLIDSRTPTGGAGGVLSGTYPNPGFAVDMATQQELNDAVALRVAISAIVDDLVSVDTQAPLSANQGRVLKVALDNINTLLTSDNFDLDTFQEIVDFIELNRETLDSLTTGSIAGLDAALADRYTKAQADLLLVGKVGTGDPRLTDARDWTATEVSQFEAETGEATTARKWTSLRVRQAIVAWWNGISSTFGRSLVAAADADAAKTLLEIGAGGWDALIEPTVSSGVLDIDLTNPAGFAVTLTEDVTTLTFSNVPAGKVVVFTIEFTQDGTGGWAITWPASVQGTPEQPRVAAGAVSIMSFYTRDGGATVYQAPLV